MNRYAAVVALGLVLFATPLCAEPWSYRGSLSTHGKAAEGFYDLRLSFHDRATRGRELRAPITLSGVAVRGGEFAADIEIDSGLLSNDAVWIGLEVSDGTGAFAAVPQRQRFDPKGSALTCWDTFGNTGTDGATNFLGTTDAQPLKLRAGNRPALTIEPADLGHVNSIGGGSVGVNNAPRVTAGVSGAVIGGGGAPSGPFNGIGAGDFHAVSDDDGVVGGGFGNKAGNLDATVTNAAWATVSGGLFNNAGGETSVVSGGSSNGALAKSSTVPGGFLNAAGGEFSFAAGRRAKVRAAAASGDANGDEGTFVWADTLDADHTSTGPNQFLVRATGGAGINVAPVQLISPTPRAGLMVDSLTADGAALMFNPVTGAALTTNNGGSMELGAGNNVASPFASTPFIDFHFGSGVPEDFNVRLVNFADGVLRLNGTFNVVGKPSMPGSIELGGDNNGVPPLGHTPFIDFHAGTGVPEDFNVRLINSADGVLRLVGTYEVTANAFKPGGGAWGALSDARTKQNIRPIDSPLARLLALEGHEFEYVDKYAVAAPGTQRGFVAQEVESLFPDWVDTDADGNRTVSIRGFEALAVEAIRELKAQHDVEVAELRAQVGALQERLERIESVR